MRPGGTPWAGASAAILRALAALVVAFLLGLAAGGPLRAGTDPDHYGPEDEVRDLATLRACLGKTPEAQGRGARAADRCLGVIAETCEGESTPALSFCEEREYNAWDKLLNEAYATLRTSLGDKGKRQLADAQRAWIALRDTSCKLVDVVADGGTIVRVMYPACLAQQTAHRMDFLQSINIFQ